MAQNEFRNALQAMSNSAASTVSAPVDGIAWLLRKAGIPIPGNALGGSDWMAQQGLTAPVRPGASQIAGDTLGLLAPMVAAAKAPQIARGLLSLDDKAMDMGRRAVENQLVRSGGIQPATVWHGSPHKFDAFDSSKIGTGEGAQAYGHGLYLAESPDVARTYSAAGSVGSDPAKAILAQAGGNYDDAISIAQKAIATEPSARRRYIREEELKALLSMREAGFKLPSGALYKVDLPDEKIARMLDWDKPASEQAAVVQELLNRAGMYDAASNVGGNVLENISGHVAKQRGSITTRLKKDQAAAAEALRKAGIPGIRYLDGGSRSAGAGSSNFVVFPGEENALRILERNGQGLLGK